MTMAHLNGDLSSQRRSRGMLKVDGGEQEDDKISRSSNKLEIGFDASLVAWSGALALIDEADDRSHVHTRLKVQRRVLYQYINTAH